MIADFKTTDPFERLQTCCKKEGGVFVGDMKVEKGIKVKFNRQRMFRV